MSRPRPFPPERMLGGFGLFEPALDVGRWARETFINDGAVVQNEDHEHLQQAKIGFVWTNEPNERKGRMILGTCQLMPPSGDKWSVGRSVQQIGDWFDGLPDFLIILYAPAASEMDDASFMALVYHELLHAAQKRDQYGDPAFSKETGDPLWAIRGHDIEEFVSVIRLFGAESCGASEFVRAANEGPLLAPAQMRIACGNCLTN